MRLLSFFSFFSYAHAITRGINWYGHETELGKFSCSWAHDTEHYLDKLSGIGFNSLRIPFSYQYVRNGDFSSMDHFFDVVPRYNMTVVLDFHRVHNYAQSPVPTDGISKEEYWDAWSVIANRYKDRKELVALELFNEYQGGDAGYWNDLMGQTVSHLESKFPNRFDYYINGMNWGSNLAGISLENLPTANRTRYTIHRYIFNSNNDWDTQFGPHADKVLVTEWGFRTPDEGEDQTGWARSFIDYLKKRNIRDTYFWTLSHSSDTKALFYDDCENINWNKFNIIKTLWEDKRRLRRSE